MNRTIQRISSVLAVGCAGLLISCSHETESPQPTGSRVQPDLACNAKPADRELSNVVVHGGKFTPMPSTVLEGDNSSQLILPRIELIQAKDLAGVDATTNKWLVPDDLANPAASQVHWRSEQEMSFDIKPDPKVAEGVYTIKVTNPDGTRAVEIPMGVAILPPPMLTELKPPAICDDQSDQVVTLVGTNFLRYEDADGKVHLPTVRLASADAALGSKEYTPSDPLAECVQVVGNFAEKKVELCKSMQITVKAQDWVVTQATKLKVVVTNPAPANCSSSEALELTVNPPPTVTGVQPQKVCEGGSTLAITGTGFQEGAIVSIKCGDKPPVDAATVDVVDATQITATFGPGASAGEKCDVIVRNPDSCEDRPLPHKQVTVVAGPILFYVDPGVVYNGMNTWITLFSTAITPPLPTDAVTIIEQTTKVATQLDYQTVTEYPNRLRALVLKDQPAGVYDVQLKDDSGCLAFLVGGLRITNATTIVLKSVDPPFGWTDEDTAVTIFRDTASGTAFQQTPRVFLNPSNATKDDAAAELVNVNFVDGDRATGIVPKGTPVNEFDVIVVNPDGAVGVLTKGYKSVTNAPPVITSLTPGSLPASTDPQSVTLFGRNFADGNTVAVTCKAAAGTTSNPATTASAPTCNAGACTEGITINTSTLSSGDVCVVRLTNPDGAYADYSAIGITTPSLNLADARKGTDMNVGRRALASAAGQATPAARFVYAIGGDDGTPANAFDSSEFAPVDLYGAMGNWVSQTRNPLGSKRTLTAATTVGRYMYLVGGNDGSAPVATAERAHILSPRETPVIRDVDLNLVPAEGLGAGEWRYRVSALFADTNPDNPGGESLASDAFAIKLPEISAKKIEVTIFWSAPVDAAKKPLPDVVAYRIYRNVEANGAWGTEVLLATVPVTDANTPLEYTDKGLTLPAGDAPLPLGSTGKWLKLPNMNTARESAAIVSGFDPADANKFYVYALAGASTPNTGLATYEYLPVTIDPTNGRQTVGAGWTAGTSSMSVGRFQAGAWVVDKNASSFVTGSDTYIFIGAGKTGAATKTGSVEVGKIAAGGDLGTWNGAPEDFSSTTSGYGAFAGSSQLYAFGGEGPSAKGISAKMLSATTLANNSWNAGALGMTEGRYLFGFSVQSAFLFLCGGQTTAAQASKTTELAVW